MTAEEFAGAVTAKGEHFTHKVLWKTAKVQIESAIASQQGSFYWALGGMVFAFHAFEAYLNFLGERLAPDVWQDERNFFRKEPYRGFDGKVRKILELCSMEEPDRRSGPYSSIWELKELRDIIAHGKTQKLFERADRDDELARPFSDIEIYNRVSSDAAIRARDNIHAFARELHNAARPRVPHDSRHDWFGTEPFEGATAYQTRDYSGNE